MADERLFKVEVIAPDRVFYEGEVIMLELCTTEGEIGIYKNHIPMTAVVAPGIMSLRESDSLEKIAALHAGFIEILQDKVTVLAELVEWPDEIDINRAEEARIRAERRLQEKAAETNIARAEMSLRKAAIRIEAVKQ